MANTFSTSSASGSSLSATVQEESRRIALVPESHLRQLQTSQAESGTPQYAATRPKASDGTGPQSWEVVFYPTPNAALTLQYRYSLIPTPLSESHPYPLGGTQYAELLLQSCLAIAEQRSNKEEGVSTARYIERLAAAIQLDMQSLAATADGLWPVGSGPEDLTVDRDYLQRLVGRQMAFGPHPETWTHRQENEVNEAIRIGLRKFYTPPVLPGERYAHEWSFLRPHGTINTVTDQSEYDMPEDFAMLDGPMTYDPGSAVLPPSLRIPLVSEHQLRVEQQKVQYSARPEIAALRVKPQVDGEGTRWQLLLWPTPDDAYPLHYRYRSNPGLLSSGIAKPAGGMPHAQTVVESCLLAADDIRGIKNSPHFPMFMESLKASVSHDRMANCPETLGRNTDRSDGEDTGDWRDNQTHVVTYEGVEY